MMGSRQPVQILPLKQCHIAPLRNVLREEDKLEIQHAVGIDPSVLLNSLVLSAHKKQLFCLHVQDRIVGAFGVVSKTSGISTLGVPWFLASNELIEKHWRQLVRQTPYWLVKMAVGYSNLENYAWVGNKAHISWLKRIGATFEEEIPKYGVSEQTFVRFSLKKFCLQTRGQIPQSKNVSSTFM